MFDEMAPLADSLSGIPATAAGGRRLAMVCRQYRRWGLHERLEPYVDPQLQPNLTARTSNALFLRREGSRECVIVFVGDANQYWISLYMLERVLPADRHILFLKDSDRSGFVFGTPALGANHAAIAPTLGRFLKSLEINRFHLLGTSSAGFCALQSALSLGAAGAMALSPRTSIASLVAYLQTVAPADMLSRMTQQRPADLDLALLLREQAGLSHCPQGPVSSAVLRKSADVSDTGESLISSAVVRALPKIVLSAPCFLAVLMRFEIDRTAPRGSTSASSRITPDGVGQKPLVINTWLETVVTAQDRNA